MTAKRCVGEPISWLRLERYHLGELAGAERRAITEHLAACRTCAACLASIEQDDPRALPPLVLPERPRLARLPVPTAAAFSALAAAAALALMVRGGGPPDGANGPDTPWNRVKGDAIAFSLVRDDGERIVGAEGVYRDGDRFKALVTCAPGSTTSFDLAVFDSGDDPSFPLTPTPNLACGNDVPLPGAFRLTGASDETVCLVWNEGAAVDRSAFAGAVPSGDTTLCKRLRPAP